MSTTVSYKGSTIATVDNNTKTLNTAGKYLEANVILTDSGGGVDGNNMEYGIVIPAIVGQAVVGISVVDQEQIGG